MPPLKDPSWKKSAFVNNSAFIFVNLGQRLQDSVLLLQHVDSVTFCLNAAHSTLPSLSVSCHVGALQRFVHATEVPQREGDSLTFSTLKGVFRNGMTMR
jgi:hypothetical protein